MLAAACRVIQSCTANRNQLIHGSFGALLSWHIRKSWSAMVLCAPAAVTASNVSAQSQRSVGFKKMFKQAVIKAWTEACPCRKRTHMYSSSGVRATHPLLPQLLFQRCQAAFLPQHAAVPPVERTVHIQLLCESEADGLGRNNQAEIKGAEPGLREKNIWVCTGHKGGKDVLKSSRGGGLINNLCCAIKRYGCFSSISRV